MVKQSAMFSCARHHFCTLASSSHRPKYTNLLEVDSSASPLPLWLVAQLLPAGRGTVAAFARAYLLLPLQEAFCQHLSVSGPVRNSSSHSRSNCRRHSMEVRTVTADAVFRVFTACPPTLAPSFWTSVTRSTLTGATLRARTASACPATAPRC